MKHTCTRSADLRRLRPRIATLLACLLASACLQAQAQSAQETVDWMLAKKNEISGACSNTVNLGKVEITDQQIKAYTEDGNWTRYDWSQVADVTDGMGARGCYASAKIVFNKQYEGKSGYIHLWIGDEALRKKYIRAIRHMAQLKGATLVSEDLF
ncbi:hypothetical protein [Pseudoxanthomonas sp. PXM02]|uniref:hypothetical protein n=1 Tax=Pseudoxanthomonas sp. PXM02 TaxID=2769294 RepID=UPI0017846FE5|nr:hypothetical protein [Pseudoxanthomonas sp. PXM02]MBD9480752.1 hypothetical protein [Pseudoxanthomonas sp. PXM02]